MANRTAFVIGVIALVATIRWYFHLLSARVKKEEPEILICENCYLSGHANEPCSRCGRIVD